MRAQSAIDERPEAPPQADASEARRFAARLRGVLNDGALALLLSIGHRTGLFDVLATLPPSTSEAIAAEAGLHERYVREWLAAMTAGGVVEYDSASRRYALPAARAASLTRAAWPDNLAAAMQWIGVLGGVENEVIECFARGGGLPYASYERFHAVREEEADQHVVARLSDEILPLIAGVVPRLEQGADVLDVACGRGRALLQLARRFPRSRFLGYDIAAEAIGGARREAAALGLANARFEVRDVAEIETAQAFDLVTSFFAVAAQAEPERVLLAVARALRPHGTLLLQEPRARGRVEEDAALPCAPFYYALSCMHSLPVALGAGGEGLGLLCGEETLRSLLAGAGFRRVERLELPRDLANLYYVARKR